MSHTGHSGSVILTSDPAAAGIALGEVTSLAPGSQLRDWLSPGVGWVESDADWGSLASRLRRRPPVFCRHICPAQVRIPLERLGTDLDDLVLAGRLLFPYLDLTRTISVQTRILGSLCPYGGYDVNTLLSKLFVGQGVQLNVRCPEQVCSVVITPDQGFLGLSLAADNLSDWAGGARRFKRRSQQVSRAEFKLLEALELFGLSLPAGGLALDLGAAPGGWTRVLRGHTMTVTAVDPGDLDRRMASDSAVRHVRRAAQSYLRTSDERFDVILNDMRMDALDSVRVMMNAARNLKKGGWALLTLKLPRVGMENAAASALDLIREKYEIIGARQLFHNRSEITVVVRPMR